MSHRHLVGMLRPGDRNDAGDPLSATANRRLTFAGAVRMDARAGSNFRDKQQALLIRLRASAHNKHNAARGWRGAGEAVS